MAIRAPDGANNHRERTDVVTLLKRKGNSCRLSMEGQHLTSGLMHSKKTSLCDKNC